MKKTESEFILFYCLNALTSDDIAFIDEKYDHIKLKSVSLPCSGKINLLYLLKAFETGADGVILVSCETGKCKYLQGNIRAKKRIDAINELLVETGLEKDLIRLIRNGNIDIKKELISTIADLEVKIRLKEFRN